MPADGFARPDYHPPLKRSVEIAGHKTSISLEPLFWELLREAAGELALPINALVARIDAERIEARAATGLAGAIRLWLVTWLSERQRKPGDGADAQRSQHATPQAE